MRGTLKDGAGKERLAKTCAGSWRIALFEAPPSSSSGMAVNLATEEKCHLRFSCSGQGWAGSGRAGHGRRIASL